MPICLHKWSTIKRWHASKEGLYRVIQRCRRCDAWRRCTFDLKGENLEMQTDRYNEKTSQPVVEVVESHQINESPSSDNNGLKT